MKFERSGFVSFEKIEKENLTDDLIKQDIINEMKKNSSITIDIILMIVSVFFALCLSFFTVFAWLIVLIPVVAFFIRYGMRKKKIKEIKNGEFVVVLDKLLYEKQGELRTNPTFYKPRLISYLQFLNNGRWELDGSYYLWSHKYNMSDTGICNTSCSNDTFYVVLDKKQKKYMAYNTKFFDYKQYNY